MEAPSLGRLFIFWKLKGIRQRLLRAGHVDRQSDLAGTWVVVPGAEATGAVVCWLTGAIAMLSGAKACCGAATCRTCVMVGVPIPCNQCRVALRGLLL